MHQREATLANNVDIFVVAILRFWPPPPNDGRCHLKTSLFIIRMQKILIPLRNIIRLTQQCKYSLWSRKAATIKIKWMQRMSKFRKILALFFAGYGFNNNINNNTSAFELNQDSVSRTLLTNFELLNNWLMSHQQLPATRR